MWDLRSDGICPQLFGGTITISIVCAVFHFYGDQAKGAPGEAEAFLLEEVRISVDDLLQIMQAYRSKNKIKRILISTLFKRRQEEAEMAIDRAMSRLQVSSAGHDMFDSTAL